MNGSCSRSVPLTIGALSPLVAVLVLLLPLPVSGSRNVAKPPPLDIKRLVRAYPPHIRGVDLDVSAPTLSPDGQRAFYVVVERDAERYKNNWHTLFAVRRDGSHIRKLAQWREPSSDAYWPDERSLEWEPDNRHVLVIYGSWGDISLDGVHLRDLDVETGERRDLSRPWNASPLTGLILQVPSWRSFSPDGRYLLMTLGSGRFIDCNKRLVRIDCRSGKRALLTSARTASFDGRWSPDGKRIAYISLPDAGESNRKHQKAQMPPLREHHLYVMNADGTNKRRLTGDTDWFEEEVSWSADGRTIYFVRYRIATGDRTRCLWMVRPDGSRLARVRELLPNKDSRSPYPPAYW